ncbi:MAG: hypothetical protein AAGM67_18910 [Bacteroidota bacterium]
MDKKEQKIRDLLRKAEEHLKALEVPVTCWVEMQGLEEEYALELGFARPGLEWGLYVREGSDHTSLNFMDSEMLHSALATLPHLLHNIRCHINTRGLNFEADMEEAETSLQKFIDPS